MNNIIHSSSPLIAVADRDGIQSVNARDLHEFLEVGKDFSNWIKDRIQKYNFTEGQDYLTQKIDSPNSANQSGRGGDRRSIEYHLTLDMAKELSMVERNEKGKQARQYFIECERRAKSSAVDPMVLLSDPATVRALLLNYSEQNMALKATVEEQRPKVDAYDRLATAQGSLCIRDAAKDLQVGEKVLINYLNQNKWIYRREGCKNWVGYRTKEINGLIEHKIVTVAITGEDKVYSQVRITPKGMAKLAGAFNEVPSGV